MVKDCNALFDTGTPLHGYYPLQGLLGLCMMMAIELKIGVVLILAMRKARFHKGQSMLLVI